MGTKQRPTEIAGDATDLAFCRGGAPPGLDWSPGEPVKVQLSMGLCKVGASMQVPSTAQSGEIVGSGGSEVDNDEQHADLATRNELLAQENARLAQENVLLQHQMTANQQHSWWQPPLTSWHPLTAERWAAATCTQQLQPGMMVIFQGLQSAVELNGQWAVVERWDTESGRWVVRLPNHEDKFVKPENLVAVASSATPPSKTGASELNSTKNNSTCGSGPMKQSSTINTGSSFSSDTTATGRSRVSSFAGEDSLDAYTEEEISTEAKTTVMMRNLPNDYSREMLLKLIDTQGFRGCYNLFYLPMDYNSRVSFGYAFIDLVSPEEAKRFHAHFQGFDAWASVSSKVCEVCWSSVLQGVQAHVDRYRNSPVMHETVPDDFKPLLFVDGKRVPFPTATKPLRVPRARRKDPI